MNSRTRGFAFLDFVSRHEAENAYSALRHTHLLGRHLVLEWAETGGPASPSRPPGPRGFGRELIEQALPYELDARTSWDVHDGGVHCTIELPLEERRP